MSVGLSDGHHLTVRMYIALLRGRQGQPLHFISQVIDITEQKLYEISIQRMAYRDVLTGIGNRLYFEERLHVAVAKAQELGDSVGIIYLDLDRFKYINDSAGHKAGDKALQVIAERLAACIRKNDAIARMGGDEFTVLLSSISNRDDLGKIAHKLLCAIEQPIYIGGKTYQVSASVGMAVYPRDAANPDQLLCIADQAMYCDKRSKGIDII